MSKLEWMVEESWCNTGHIAVDVDGFPVSPLCGTACKWDLFGALRVSYYEDDDFWASVDKAKKAFKFVFKQTYDNLCLEKSNITLADMNDALEYRDLRRLLMYIN